MNVIQPHCNCVFSISMSCIFLLKDIKTWAVPEPHIIDSLFVVRFSLDINHTGAVLCVKAGGRLCQRSFAHVLFASLRNDSPELLPLCCASLLSNVSSFRVLMGSPVPFLAGHHLTPKRTCPRTFPCRLLDSFPATLTVFPSSVFLYNFYIPGPLQIILVLYSERAKFTFSLFAP